MINNWQKKSIGPLLIDTEAVQLKNLLPRYTGRNLLSLDGSISKETLAFSPIEHHFFCHENYNVDVRSAFQNSSDLPTMPDILGRFEELPLLSDRVDLIIAPHLLDFALDPKIILKELWRILAPEGRVIIMGFNSSALLGLSSVLEGQNQSTPFLSANRLRKLLIAQGFSLDLFKTFFFRPTFLSPNALKRLRFLEILGDTCWPHMGALYLFVARKPILSVTPFREVKRSRQNVLMPKGMMDPAGRSII